MDEQRPAIERLRDAACLAHTVPGVTLRLSDDTRELLVSASCLAAAFDPCRFRGLVIGAGRLGALATLDRIEIVGGLVHLGGGIYQSSHPGSAGERWFISTLAHDQVVDLLTACPLDSADAHSVVIKPDRELGRCAVRVRGGDCSAAGQLDEIAMWAMTTCLVEELIGECSSAPSRHDVAIPDHP